ncbi:MAG TPA: hypothetical protein VGS20_05750, partial [Candidatus Acidoferrales bacterium]|nr:hypothetical protein [Candidatus Acidoferrales bacterium]
MLLQGRFRILFLYDVAEDLDLAKIGALLGPRAGPAKPAFPRRTPEYVRFERAPIVEPCDPVTLPTGERLTASIKYYAFAAVVLQFEAPFECDWDALLPQASRWMDAPDLEPYARELVRRHLDRVTPAVTRPTGDWLQEGYLVIHLEEIRQVDSRPIAAKELLTAHAEYVMQLVRGETEPLAPRAADELLASSLSYYPTDLVVVRSSGALVYDRSEDADATIQVLEYAKIQLLEFRYYDSYMSQVLADVYTAFERKRNVLVSRWSLPRAAKRLNTIRLDVMDLTERIDNAIKFVSDIYYARVYQMAAA